MATQQSEVINANQALLNSVASGDFATYESLCADDLTCFEPETRGLVIQGRAFHKFFFDFDAAMSIGKDPSNLPIKNISMANPHVRCLGENAVVLSYTRLDQFVNGNQVPDTKSCSETRVWEKRDGKWVHVHFHKS